MGQRIPTSRVLTDLLRKGVIKNPPAGGYRWLHGLVLSGIVPAEQDPHTLRWSVDEDNLPNIAAIILAAQPASTRPTSARTPLPVARPRPGKPAPRAAAPRAATEVMLPR